MPAIVYYDADADSSLLTGKTVAILGYGSQGHAHALNLKDSGIDVVVGLREGSSSKAKAEAAGLKVLPTGEAVKAANIVMVCCPTPSRRRSSTPTSPRTCRPATRSRSRTGSTCTSAGSLRPKVSTSG